ncbi:UNVERIFIED_CONTAM: transcriptional regulator [Actinomycetes bacterium ARC8]|uniref:transcriptional regulator n=1 Tax=Pseudarthrobacter oxydans TaxID=1671 RepID=UPI0029387BF8|nr:transcriptional regulator [Actinomycetes bacterium ARC8]
MSTATTPELLVLHAVRVLGYAGTERVIARVKLDEHPVRELIQRAQAAGQVTWTQFADQGGWSLTEAGKAHGEHLLAAELGATKTRTLVQEVLDGFGPLNSLVAGACTRWQLTELGLAQPPADLEQILADLARAADELEVLEARLSSGLSRFAGYHCRFTAAVEHARRETGWICGTDRDSAHQIWFELHEDLLATLGRSR